jgi:hypothetical protein
MSNLKGRGGLWLRTGKIVHLYRKIGVAVVELERPLARGTPIYIHGATTSYEQVATSMEIDHEQVKKAKAGVKIGLKLAHWARKKDVVYQWVEGIILAQTTKVRIKKKLVKSKFSNEKLLLPDELELEEARRTLKRQQRRIAALKLRAIPYASLV